jgi:hypothetical protein
MKPANHRLTHTGREGELRRVCGLLGTAYIIAWKKCDVIAGGPLALLNQLSLAPLTISCKSELLRYHLPWPTIRRPWLRQAAVRHQITHDMCPPAVPFCRWARAPATRIPT